MALFHMLFPHLRSNLMRFPHVLNVPIRNDCLEMHKSVFDVYQFADDEMRQHIIDEADYFMVVLSKYYKVVYIKWNANMITFEFRIATISTEFAFPEMVTVNQNYTLKSELKIFPTKWNLIMTLYWKVFFGFIQWIEIGSAQCFNRSFSFLGINLIIWAW